MLNQMAASSVEPKMYSAIYVENYLDSVENLPNDVQRILTRIREIDLQYRSMIFSFNFFLLIYVLCSSLLVYNLMSKISSQNTNKSCCCNLFSSLT